MRTKLVAFGVGALAASAALADTIAPLDQDRSVNTFLIVPQCLDQAWESDAAQAFEPFDGALVTVLFCPNGLGSGFAEQQSQIGPGAMVASGSGQSQAQGPGQNVIHAFGYSIFDVTFQAPVAAQFSLAGSIEAGASDGPLIVLAGAVVSLTDASGAAIFAHSIEPGPGGQTVTRLIHAAGTLQPGTYRLRAEADSIIDNTVPPDHSGLASFELIFTLMGPCPADADDDGNVGITDLLALLSAWGTNPLGPPDTDGDGNLGITDFLALLAAWGPCP